MPVTDFNDNILNIWGNLIIAPPIMSPYPISLAAVYFYHQKNYYFKAVKMKEVIMRKKGIKAMCREHKILVLDCLKDFLLGGFLQQLLLTECV